MAQFAIAGAAALLVGLAGPRAALPTAEVIAAFGAGGAIVALVLRRRALAAAGEGRRAAAPR